MEKLRVWKEERQNSGQAIKTNKPRIISTSEFYDVPCKKCNKKIPRTGKRGRPPFLCNDCKGEIK